MLINRSLKQTKCPFHYSEADKMALSGYMREYDGYV